MREAIGRLQASAAALDPGPEQRDELWSAVGEHVLGNLAELGRSAAYFEGDELDPALFEVAESPAPVSDALGTMKAVERTGINQASGGQFAFIPGGGLFPAALGDLLADVSNCYSGVRSGAPAAALMERSLLRWMAGLLGYPETAGGDLTSGASIANLEGIVTARDAIGISSADVPRSVVYLTSQTHHCVDKALRISGLVRASSAAWGWTTVGGCAPTRSRRPCRPTSQPACVPGSWSPRPGRRTPERSTPSRTSPTSPTPTTLAPG